MAKLWPVLLIAAAAVVLLVFVMGGGENGGYDPDDDELDFEKRTNPELLTAEGAAKRKKAAEDAAREAAKKRRMQPPKETKKLFLQGIVVSADGRKPIVGARLTAEAASPDCPRLLPFAMRSNMSNWGYHKMSTRMPKPYFTTTGKDGRFRWMVDPFDVSEGSTYDVFTGAAGYVTTVTCAPPNGSDVTIELRRALKQEIVVTDRHGRPVEAAKVILKPAEGTPLIPGHAGYAHSDKNGRCEIDGLLPGAVMLTADHLEFMPGTLGPIDPVSGDAVEIKLAPAFRLSFKIRSDDGSEIKNPTLQWVTDGKPPHTDLKLLKTTATGPTNQPLAEVTTAPVRIPCDHKNVRFELKADGFEPWRPEPEPLPAEGGEREIIVALTRDTTLASLRVNFVGPDGKAVPYATMQAQPSITRLDGKDPGPVVLEGGETLFFPALPAGPYRIGVRCAKYAPGEVDAELVAGEENEAKIKLGEPAKLLVRFTASERMRVRFRLVQQGRIVPAFREGAAAPAPDGSGPRPLTAAGNEGVVFTGLPSGRITIEVTSPELIAAPRSVTLRKGETTEAEIEVRRR